MTEKDPPQHSDTKYPRVVTTRTGKVDVSLTIPSHEALMHFADTFGELAADLWFEGKLKIDTQEPK